MDDDLVRKLPGGVIQHELRDKDKAADNLEVKRIDPLLGEEND